MLLAPNCHALQTLDGLDIDRDKIAKQDEVWERLRELGVLRRKPDVGKEEDKPRKEVMQLLMLKIFRVPLWREFQESG